MSDSDNSLGWLVMRGAQHHGPFLAQQLVEMANAKQIAGDTLVVHAKHTGGKQVRARSIKRLKLIFDSQCEELEPLSAEQINEDEKTESGSVSGEMLTIESVKIASKPTQHTTSSLKLRGASKSVGSNSQKATKESTELIADGQSKLVLKLLEVLSCISESEENPHFTAIQSRRNTKLALEAVVLTNHRFLLVQQESFGRSTLQELLWQDVKAIQIKEDIVCSTVSLFAFGGIELQVEWLAAEQANSVYRIARVQAGAARRSDCDSLLSQDTKSDVDLC